MEIFFLLSSTNIINLWPRFIRELEIVLYNFADKQIMFVSILIKKKYDIYDYDIFYREVML